MNESDSAAPSVAWPQTPPSFRYAVMWQGQLIGYVTSGFPVDAMDADFLLVPVGTPPTFNYTVSYIES